MTLLELAAQCEAAAGPDRALDADIAAAVCVKQLTYEGGAWIKDPEFTASLDAAMTLVPESWMVRSESWPANPVTDAPAHSHVELWQCSEKQWGRDRVWGHGSDEGKAEADARTLPLALCAAALKTRAAQAIEAQRAATPKSEAVEDESAVR